MHITVCASAKRGEETEAVPRFIMTVSSVGGGIGAGAVKFGLPGVFSLAAGAEAL